MNTQFKSAALPRFKLTALMILCGLASAGAASVASAASAANREGDVPVLSVKYDPQSLGNDVAVRALYGRIVAASREVCPDMSVGHPWIGEAAVQCRKQAIAQAVKKINNPRLAALYVSNSKNG